MKFNLLIWLIFCFFTIPKTTLCSDSEDMIKEKIDNLTKEVVRLRTIDIDSASASAYKALKLAEGYQLDDKIADLKYQLGIITCMKNDHDLAEQYFIESMEYYEEAKQIKNIAKLHDAFGKLYRITGKYYQSIQNLEKAIKIKEEKSDSLPLAISLNNLALTYLRLTEYPKAIEYAQKANIIAKRIKDTNEIFNSGNTIANIYFLLKKNDQAIKKYNALLNYLQDNMQHEKSVVLNNIANILLDDKQYQEARKKYRQCSIIFEQLENKNGESISLLNIGHTYYEENALDSAEFYYQTSLNIAQKIEDHLGIADGEYYLGIVDKKRKSFSEAILHIKQSIAIYENEDVNDRLSEAYKKLSEIYEEQGDYKSALSTNIKHQLLYNQIQKQENSSFLESIVAKVEAETKAEIMEKNLQLQKAKYDNMIRLIVISLISILVICIIGLFLYKSKKQLIWNKYILKKKEDVHNSVYKTMKDDIHLSLFNLAYEIAKIDNKEQYERMSKTFNEFSQYYNSILSKIKSEVN